MDELYKQAKIAHQKGDTETLEAIKLEISKLKSPREDVKNEKYKSYPSYDNPDFNYDILQKAEFHRNKYKPITKSFNEVVKDKCSTSSFKLTENQKFVKNFLSPLTPYNSLLLFHSVGVGKSCSSISIAEQFIPEFKKKILVIVSKNLKDNFMKQLFDISKLGIINGMYNDTSNQCTGMKYPNLIADRHTLNPDALNDKVKKLINERYEFKGFMEFANDYERLQKKIETTERIESKREKRFNAKLKETYSNRLILIDEVHNLRLATESSQKKVPPKLMRVIEVSENVKLLLLTATPMFNNVTEIVWLLNLMLANDNRPPIKTEEIFDKGNITKEGKKKLIEVSRGYISYMRGENPYTFPSRIYPTINKDNNVFMIKDKPSYDIFNIKISDPNTLEVLELVKSQMSKYQRYVYSRLETQLKKKDIEGVEEDLDNADDDSIVKDEDEKNGTDIQMGLQISNIVFPTIEEEENIRDYYGQKTFNKCFKNVGPSKSFKFGYENKILDKYGEFLHPNKIGEYAPKLKTILDYIEKSEGIVYIYSSFLSSGIIPLAIALEHMGFSKYGGNNILHTSKNIKPFKVKNKTAQYIILSASPELSPNFKDEIDIAKNKNNSNGEIIKVIIGSNVATEGIDFKNIREIHILEPWYHLNKIEQIVGRGVRNCSHIDLPLEKRNTTIYKHVNTRDDDKRETIDVRIYRIADNKQSKISKVEKILKKNSIDCLLNHNVLYFDPDKVNMSINLKTSQGLIIKDYKIGDTNTTSLTCYARSKSEPPILSTNLDTSTFDMYFLDDDIEIYIGYIVTLFKTKSIYTYTEIHDNLSKIIENMETDVLKYAINRMIINKRKVLNNKNNLGYIIYRSKKYIFQRHDKPDTRMTLEEREDDINLSHRRLDISFLTSKHKTIEKIVSETDTYTKIQNNVDNIMKLMNDNDYITYIYDFVIDRLNGNELLSVVSDILIKLNTTKSVSSLNEIQKIIFESLKKSDVFLKITNNIPKYYVDVYGGKDMYYIIDKNDNFIKCPNISRSDVIKLEETLQTHLLNTYKHINGFITNELITNRFKLIMKEKDNSKDSKSGSVCYQNSNLKVPMLKEMISKIDTNFKLPKATKGSLCDIYEILIRKQQPLKFARPYQYYLISQKKK
jgi:hypothetical protein